MDYLRTFLSQKKRHEGEVIVWYVLKIQLKLKNVRQISGKISAQPHTVVKQICFPNGNLLFLSLFSLSKN